MMYMKFSNSFQTSTSPTRSLSGNRWSSSYILAVSLETLRKKEVYMRCTFQVNLVLYCPNNMAKQMPSQTEHSGPPVFTGKQRHTLAIIC